MQLDEYVEQVAEQLRASAALADEHTRQVATALAGTAQAAVRLALIAAVSAAADEISSALLEAGAHRAPTVGVHLDGDELRLSVAVAPEQPTEPPTDEGEATARISLRLSEKLKAAVDEAAARDSVSVNTWLVRAASAALTQRPGDRTGWGAPEAPWGGGHGHGAGTHRVTGWVSG